jgi:cytochrome c oxidase cbb3-type subunit 3
MSEAVSIFVTVGVLGGLLAFFLLLQMNRKVNNEGKTTGHKYDGIEELDNPLPAWWYWVFVASIIYGLGYLAYYPGLGNFPGLSGWTSAGQLKEDEQKADERYGPMFAKYMNTPIAELSTLPAAKKMGQRIFASNCAVCHGATAKGSFGFPNLTDGEWIWGDDDAQLKSTILNGRMAVMPPWGEVLGDKGVTEVSEYVLQLAGRTDADSNLAGAGEKHYGTYCAVCHGPQGMGQAMFGAPNLTNELWLYGNSRLNIQDTVRNGRNGQMPAFERTLGPEKSHIVAAYVRSLQSGSAR